MLLHSMARAFTLCTALLAIGAAGCGDIKVSADNDAAGGEDFVKGDAPDVQTKTCGVGKHSECDDKNSCTDDRCEAGVCVNTERDNVCNIDDECYAHLETKPDNKCFVCDTAASTTAWSDVVCDDSNSCTTEACDFKTGCVYDDLEDGAACDDGSACSKDDACKAGECVGTCVCEVDADCGDTPVGPCEKAVCADNVCVATSDLAKDGQTCTDGDKCVTGAVCAAGVCGGGTPKDCSASGDGACTVGACNPDTGGCEAQAAEAGTSCDDGDPCTVSDACGAGGCEGAPMDCGAFDGPCTSGLCQAGTCLAQVKVGQSCVHANACIVEAVCLEDGTCQGKWDTGGDCACETNADCKDNLGCTQEVCNVETGECSFPVVGGTCFINGKCVFAEEVNSVNSCQVCDPAEPTSWSPYPCDDGNPCTTDTCDPLLGCVSTPAPGAECDDGDPCTQNEMCNAQAECVGTCPCKTDEQCEGAAVEVGACERVACVGFECVAVPDTGKNGTSCDDGDLCTTGEVCDAGECLGGAAVSCDAGDPAGCSTTACDPTTGQCVATNKAAGTQCDDKDPCTLTDQCSADGACAGVPLDCSEFDDACNAGSCEAGKCVTTPKSGEPCDDGEKCTTGDVCDASGNCEGSWDAELAECGCPDDAWCDDGLDCTVEFCSSEKKCVYTVKDGFCSIGKTCFAAEAVNPNNACQVCKPALSKSNWQSLNCDDGNPCTDDTCNTATGCQSVTDDTNSCNDGEPCTKDDHCEDGACVGYCPCKVDGDCEGTPSACNRFACQNYECVEVADTSLNGSACEDGKYCTTGDVCQSGECKAGPARDCSASGDGVCTVGACDEVGDKCVPQAAPDGNACSDGNSCTQDDACSGGVCKGTPLDCSAYADQCNAAACVGGSCKKTPLTGTACNDGDATCTINDKCTSAGTCVGTWDCGCQSDGDCAGFGDTCNTGRCDVSSGECYKEPKLGEACDDGSACTSADQCDANGKCTGSAYSCDDGLACTEDVCDGAGGCSNPVKSGQCLVDGKCYNGGQLNPDNVCQKCTSGTSWSNNDGATCDDKAACTQGDVCGGGVCKGTSYVCDDGLACTTDSCDGKGGCNHAIGSAHCVIGGACVAADAKNPNNPCQSCQPTKSKTAWSNNNDSCDDGVACTHSDVCSGGTCGGTAYVCNDGKGCTTDTCDGKGGCSYPVAAGNCLINTSCYANGATNPANSCEQCAAATSQTKWSAKSAGTACNDGLSCTTGDACNAEGQCVGSLAGCTALACETASCTEDGCLITLKAGYCKIDGACHVDGASDGNNTCRKCDAAKSTSSWTNVSGSCSDGNDCTHSDACASGACAGTGYLCDDKLACTADSCDGKGGCKFTQDKGTCLIDGVCYKDGEPNPDNPCQVCNASTSASAWSNVADGTACPDDKLSCTHDVCAQGQCTHPLDPKSGSCLIGSTCVQNGTTNPSNDCQACDIKSSTSAWTPKPAGSTCADDGNPCTDDICSSKATCSHPSKANFTACSDGKTTTYGDWCYNATCSGFTRALSSSFSSGVDEYTAASPGPSSDVYAVHQSPASLTVNSYTQHFKGGTSSTDSNLLGKGAPKMTLGWNYLVFGSSLRVWDSSTTSWVNSSTSGSLSAAFNALPNGTWTGSKVWSSSCSQFPCIITTSYKFAGRDAENTKMTVRGCSGWSSFSCSDEAVSTTNEFPVAVVRLSTGEVIIVANYNSETSPTIVDFLRYNTSNSAWAYDNNMYVSVSGQRALEAEAVGNQIVVVGTGGLLLAGGTADMVKVTLPGLSNQASTDFWDVATDGKKVFVIGRYQTSSAAIFYIAHADATSNLTLGSSWTVNTFANTGCKLGDCPGPEQYSLKAIEVKADEFFLFGGWANTATGQMDKAVFRWTP